MIRVMVSMKHTMNNDLYFVDDELPIFLHSEWLSGNHSPFDQLVYDLHCYSSQNSTADDDSMNLKLGKTWKRL